MSLTDGIIYGCKFDQLTGNYVPTLNNTLLPSTLTVSGTVTHGIVGRIGYGIQTQSTIGYAFTNVSQVFANGIGPVWTMAMWVNPVSATAGINAFARLGSSLATDPTAGGKSFQLNYQTNGKILFAQFTPPAGAGAGKAFMFVKIDATAVALDGNWHLVVCTYDMNGVNQFASEGIGTGLAVGRFAMHLDGSNGTPTDPIYPLQSVARTETIPGVPVDDIYGAMYVGASVNGGNAIQNAKMDEVFVWNRVLSNAEVVALYNGGAGVDLSAVPTPPELPGVSPSIPSTSIKHIISAARYQGSTVLDTTNEVGKIRLTNIATLRDTILSVMTGTSKNNVHLNTSAGRKLKAIAALNPSTATAADIINAARNA